jgi:hypothetical protein
MTRRRQPDPQLNGRPRRRATTHVRNTQPNCHLCGMWIDQTLDRQRHPLASCIDELIPRALGGSPTDPNNTAHAHRLCNGIRGTRPVTPALQQRCRQAVTRILNQITTQNPW